jgi:hypothetical protein
MAMTLLGISGSLTKGGSTRVDVLQHAPGSRKRLRAQSADTRPGGGHAPAPPGQSDGPTATEPHGQTTRLSVTGYTARSRAFGICAGRKRTTLA